MIFGFIVKVLKALIDGFASVCAFLLWTLGLWLPAVYSVLYLIVCAIAGIRLQGPTVTVYIVGLVLAFCGSVAFGVLRFRRGKRVKKSTEKSAPSQTRSVKKREIIPSPVYEHSPEPGPESDLDSGGYSEPAYSSAAPDPAYGPTEEKKENIVSAAKNDFGGSQTSYKYEDFADLRRKYFGEENAADSPPQGGVWSSGEPADAQVPRNIGADDYDPVAFDRLADARKGRTTEGGYVAPSCEQLERRLMGGDVSDEQPMVFAMRKDPDVIVYEYSDRLKFYRKTKRGLVHISTEFKR